MGGGGTYVCIPRSFLVINVRNWGKDLFNARHPDVLLKTIKIYKYRQNTTKFIIG